MGTPTKITKFAKFYDFGRGSHCKSQKNRENLENLRGNYFHNTISHRKNNIFRPDFFLRSGIDLYYPKNEVWALWGVQEESDRQINLITPPSEGMSNNPLHLGKHISEWT